MMAENVIYMAALTVIILACLLGVFTQKFDDNLIQRIGFAIACLGTSVELMQTVLSNAVVDNTRCLMTYGIATMCMGTAFKFWRKN